MTFRYPCKRAHARRCASAAQGLIFVIAVIGSVVRCAPYGGAPLILARSDRPRIPGYRVESVDIVSKKEGALIHGRICREVPGTYPINRLSVEHLDHDGCVLAAAEAYVFGMTSWRRPACAYYSAQTGWMVN